MAVIVLRGLQPNKSYHVMVRARSQDGTFSPYSKVYDFSTPSTNSDGSALTASNTSVVQYVGGTGAIGVGAFTAAGLTALSSVNLLNVWNGSEILQGTAGLGGIALTKNGLMGYKFGDPAASAARFFLDAGTGNAYFRGAIVATTASIGGANGIIYDGSAVTIGTGVTILGSISASSMRLNPYNYWVNTGSFSLGDANRNITWDQSGILRVAGSITADTGSFIQGTVSNGTISGGSINVPATSPLFTVDSFGNMVAQSASINGRITATSGSIGSFAITSNSLYSGPSGSVAGLIPGSTRAFFAGGVDSSGNSASFYVTNSGSLVANAANITGTIQADSGYFTGSIKAGSVFAGSISAVTASVQGALITGAVYSGSVTATAGSFTGDIFLANPGRLIAGNPGQSAVIVSSSGITGASAGLAVFTLPADGTSPTIGAFQVVKTGLTAVGQYSGSVQGTSGAASISITTASAASALFIGMAASGTGIANGAVITNIAYSPSSSIIYLSAVNTGTVSTTASFYANANLQIGTSTNDGIVIRGQNAPGLGPAIFTKIGGTGTTATTGSGFYLGQDGQFRLANSGGVVSMTSGNLAVTGSITATAGSIGGFTIGGTSLYAGTGASYTGIIPGSNKAFFAGATDNLGTSASFFVSNSGSLYAVNASITGVINRLTFGRGSGDYVSNIAIGEYALSNNTTGQGLVAIGYNTLSSNTTANYNFAIGYQALKNNTNGAENIAIGGDALLANIGGSNNLAIGQDALYSNTGGNQNTAVGRGTLYSNITGVNNIAIGDVALNRNLNDNNIAIGANSLYYNTNGSRNVAVGTFTLYSNNLGSYNVSIGDNAMVQNVSGNYNVAIGAYSLYSSSVSNFNIAIGNYSLFTASSTAAVSNIAIGSGALYSNASGAYNISLGENSSYSNNRGYYNLVLGYYSLYNNTSGSFNIAFGHQALYKNTTGSYNISIGYQSSYSAASARFNIGIGASSLWSSSAGDYNVGIGWRALANNFSGDYNVALGYQALNKSIFPSQDTAIGYNAGGTLLRSSANVIVGNDAMGNIEEGNFNTAIGNSALRGTGAAGAKTRFNTAIGYYSLINNNTGSYNVALGYSAGVELTTGSANVFIGGVSGTGYETAHNNIFIGDGLGNLLFIGNPVTNVGSFKVPVGHSDDDTFNGTLTNTSPRAFFGEANFMWAYRDGGTPAVIGRVQDGTLVTLYSGTTSEGSISVSGTTVSYNTFAGAHWSQFKNHAMPEIYPGTVLETIDEMCDWYNPDGTLMENDQLTKCKISDTEESSAVYGVFFVYEDELEEDYQVGDFKVLSVGAWMVRVDANENVKMGDLLVSAGNGCAKVQSDDIIRSKTIGKVTNTTPHTIYPDGSKLIPAVLYCG